MRHRAVPLRTAGGSASQFGQIVHYQMCAVAPKLVGITLARDADHEAELPANPGLHARQGIFNNNCS
jgi:hypothetical protein